MWPLLAFALLLPCGAGLGALLVLAALLEALAEALEALLPVLLAAYAALCFLALLGVILLVVLAAKIVGWLFSCLADKPAQEKASVGNEQAERILETPATLGTAPRRAKSTQTSRAPQQVLEETILFEGAKNKDDSATKVPNDGANDGLHRTLSLSSLLVLLPPEDTGPPPPPMNPSFREDNPIKPQPDETFTPPMQAPQPCKNEAHVAMPQDIPLPHRRPKALLCFGISAFVGLLTRHSLRSAQPHHFASRTRAHMAKERPDTGSRPKAGGARHTTYCSWGDTPYCSFMGPKDSCKHDPARGLVRGGSGHAPFRCQGKHHGGASKLNLRRTTAVISPSYPEMKACSQKKVVTIGAADSTDLFVNDYFLSYYEYLWDLADNFAALLQNLLWDDYDNILLGFQAFVEGSV